MVHTVQIVDIDTDPQDAFYDREPTVRPEYTDLPDQFAQALREQVIDEPENASCANCKAGVGYYLQEADDGRLEHLYWHWTTLIALPGGPVFLLCEDCVTPLSVVFDVKAT